MATQARVRISQARKIRVIASELRMQGLFKEAKELEVVEQALSRTAAEGMAMSLNTTIKLVDASKVTDAKGRDVVQLVAGKNVPQAFEAVATKYPDILMAEFQKILEDALVSGAIDLEG